MPGGRRLGYRSTLTDVISIALIHPFDLVMLIGIAEASQQGRPERLGFRVVAELTDADLR